MQFEVNPGLGLVGLPSWFWVQGYAGQPFGASQTVTIPAAVPGGQPASFTVSVHIWGDKYRTFGGDGTHDPRQRCRVAGRTTAPDVLRVRMVARPHSLASELSLFPHRARPAADPGEEAVRALLDEVRSELANRLRADQTTKPSAHGLLSTAWTPLKPARRSSSATLVVAGIRVRWCPLLQR